MTEFQKTKTEYLDLIESLHQDNDLFPSIDELEEHYMENITESQPEVMEFLNGLIGFMKWGNAKGEDPGKMMSTLNHDINEWDKNRFQNWFSPRTTRFQKYADGNIEIGD